MLGSGSMLLTGLKRFPDCQKKEIEKAYHLSEELHKGQLRLSGEPYFIHPLEVAQLLIDAGKDYETVCAGILHDTLEDTNMTYNELKSIMGEVIAYLVYNVSKVKLLADASKEDITYATDRKMFENLTTDIRVIDIRLADRTHNMATKEFWGKETQQRKARENFMIYIPMAKSIGAWRTKKFLEDSSFESLYPEEYYRIKEKFKEIKKEYEPDALKALNKIQTTMADQNIHFVESKVQFKNIYGIYEDMIFKNREIYQQDDLVNFKIIVQGIPECYATLGIVNDLFRNKNVVDYIGNPKPNLYQSLHSVVTYQDSRDALVKIRTALMDLKATYGMSYQEYTQMGGRKLFQGIAEISEKFPDTKEFLSYARRELACQKITVFTEEGKRCELAKGATVVDFAFYEGKGTRMYTAIVNGESVPLNYTLKQGDTISIISLNEERVLDEEYCQNAQTIYAMQTIQRELKRKNS